MSMSTFPHTADPVLITHGNRDGVVPYRFSVEADHCYDNSELLIINGGGHGYTAGQDREAMAAVRRFLEENLKGQQSE